MSFNYKRNILYISVLANWNHHIVIFFFYILTKPQACKTHSSDILTLTGTKLGYFFNVLLGLVRISKDESGNNKAFRHVETLFVQGRNLVPSRPFIGSRGLFTFRQPIAGLLGTRFLPWTNKVSTCRKALLLVAGSYRRPDFIFKLFFVR